MSEPKAAFTPPSLFLATLALSLATFMQVLDSTIANVALPTISGNLGVSADQGTWVITSFAVCNAIALPLTGWFTRRFGQLRLFIASVMFFTLTSFLCGFAHSMTELIIFRALQGFFAGPMFPMCQTLLLVIFPPMKRSMALALLSMVTVVAPIVGPITGGWLTDNYSCAQFNTDVDFRTIASVQMFMGIGVAFFFMPLTTIVLSNLHGNEVAEGSGLATFFRVLGGSFASSLTTWIWQRREVFHHANLTESVTQYNPAAMDYVNKMGGPTQQHLAMIDQVVTQQAYMMSTIDYFWVLGWGFMALIIIIWFTRPPFVKSGMPGAPAAGH